MQVAVNSQENQLSTNLYQALDQLAHAKLANDPAALATATVVVEQVVAQIQAYMQSNPGVYFYPWSAQQVVVAHANGHGQPIDLTLVESNWSEQPSIVTTL